MIKSEKIKNKEKELLDVLVEGPDNPRATIIFVHGFATDKHETASYFDDLSAAFSGEFRIVRFDFSGCGKSEGKLEKKDYQKWGEDLQAVIDYVNRIYKENTYILAQSMGCFVTSLLAPKGIEKTAFTGIPNSNPEYIIESLFKRFASRPGGKLDLGGISIFPRSSGAIQKIGPSFWKVLKGFKPAEAVKDFSAKTNLLIVHPKQDEVVGDKYLEEYSTIENVKVIWIDGDHSFKKPEEREALIKEIKKFFATWSVQR